MEPADEEGQDNCCVRCCAPCAVCCAPLKTACTKDKVDFLIDVGTWKEAFGLPSRCARCLSPPAFFAVRLALFLFWLGVFIWRRAVAMVRACLPPSSADAMKFVLGH